MKRLDGSEGSVQFRGNKTLEKTWRKCDKLTLADDTDKGRSKNVIKKQKHLMRHLKVSRYL